MLKVEEPTTRGPSVSFLSVTKVSATSPTSSIVMPLHKKFKEKSAKNIISHFLHSFSIRLVVITVFTLVVILLLALGGWLFMYIEKTAEVTEVNLFEDCFVNVRKTVESEGLSGPETLDRVHQCVIEASKISTTSEGVLFSWGLASTVGYGDTFPHTVWGQAISIVYGYFSIPLYMAFKIEFGEVLALAILHFGRAFYKLLRFIFPTMMHRYIGSEHPSDFLLAMLLSAIFVGFAAFTAVVVMLAENFDYGISIYLTMQSVTLIGMGDYVPNTSWQTFLIILPLFIIGDALSSYLNYYMHGIFRKIVHSFARFVTGKTLKIGDGATKRMSEFPNVTTTSMPFKYTAEDDDFDMDELYNQTASSVTTNMTTITVENTEGEKY